MYFFLDHDKISGNLSPYGPVADNETTQFRVSNIFDLNGDADAYAVVDGEMIIVKNDNVNLINIILKPGKSLDFNFTQVLYYVYLGIDKSDYITGSPNELQSEAATNSDVVKRLWQEANAAGANDPELSDLGYSRTFPNDTLIEQLFLGGSTTTTGRSASVKEGECLGKFTSANRAGFEIVLAEGGLMNTDTGISEPFQIKHFLNMDYKINVNGITDAFNKKCVRENILNFIDPAAFYALHLKVGFDANPGIGNSMNDYLSIIAEFANNNRVYIDIRNEIGYSYNFYENYGDSGSNQLKINNLSSTLELRGYNFHQWPIYCFDASLNTNTRIRFQLHAGDNSDPLLYIINGEQFVRTKGFLDKDVVSDWTQETSMYINNYESPIAKAWYIKLYFYRQADDSVNPDVFKTDDYTDNIFGPIDYPGIQGTLDPFKIIYTGDPKYVRGTLPGENNEFAFVAQTGVSYDTDPTLGDIENYVFFAKAKRVHKESGHFSTFNPPNEISLNFSNSFFNQLLGDDLRVNISKIYDGTEAVSVLMLENNNLVPPSKESIMMLCISKTEFDDLYNLSGFKENHERFLRLKNRSIISTGVNRYELYVHGIHSITLENKEVNTSPVILVYSIDNIVFSSKEFTNDITFPTFYTRNYEEEIGAEIKTGSTSWEDYFINLDTKGTLPYQTETTQPFLVIVNEFLLNVEAIANDSNARANLKAEVEDYALKLWKRGVAFVQDGLNSLPFQPDDRPLYWARLKMEVILKSHPFILQSPATEKELIKIFEEKSRNYTGVDFSAAPAGAKKVLITGFDPFFLDKLKEQSNPSGAIALALYDQLVMDGANTLAVIQTAIFPVRYRDFDNGVVENFFESLIRDYSATELQITTMSQGKIFQFAIDRFASKYRGGDTDNLGVKGNEAVLNISGQPFYETEIPVDKIVPLTNTGSTFRVIYNNDFKYKYDNSGTIETVNYECNDYDLGSELPLHDPCHPSGDFYPKITGNDYVDGREKIEDISHPHHADWMLHEFNWEGGKVPSELNNSTSNPRLKEIMPLMGSGGIYLSNEIFYRVCRLSKLVTGKNIAHGHLHVPLIQAGWTQSDIDYLNCKFTISLSRNFDAFNTRKLIEKAKELIKSSLM